MGHDWVSSRRHAWALKCSGLIARTVPAKPVAMMDAIRLYDAMHHATSVNAELFVEHMLIPRQSHCDACCVAALSTLQAAKQVISLRGLFTGTDVCFSSSLPMMRHRTNASIRFTTSSTLLLGRRITPVAFPSTGRPPYFRSCTPSNHSSQDATRLSTCKVSATGQSHAVCL